MPTRLIDVGPSDGSGQPRLRELKQRARYLTLSHCWDGGKVAMTTTSNFDERCAAISLESLSKVFQEAIHVTRLFGMRYIWIDSLCIIQDSSKDWEQGICAMLFILKSFDDSAPSNHFTESAQMCAIYKNAFFTIAASRATTGSDGLFPSLDTRLITPCFLPQFHYTSNLGNRLISILHHTTGIPIPMHSKTKSKDHSTNVLGFYKKRCSPMRHWCSQISACHGNVFTVCAAL